MAILRHSIPAWILSPRGANPKFQAGVELAGIGPVKDRLLAIEALSDEFSGETASNQPFLTSVHLLHEVRSEIPECQPFNNKNAISFGDLKSGIKDGSFPRILAVTAPAFGFIGVEQGAILSPNQEIRKMARKLHLEALERSAELKKEGSGEGVVIWWPAFDSRRLDFEGMPLSFKGAWDKLTAFWIDLLTGNDWMIWLEWKPADPGIDYLCTLKLAIEFCNWVNETLGRKAMVINNEWAHLLIGGLTVAEGTRRTIEAGLFTGMVHVNSAQLLSVSLENFMAGGCEPEEIATGMDWDWAVGMGGDNRYDDQKEAVKIMDNCGVETIFAEHDINPAGQNPIEYAKTSIENLETMLLVVRK